MVRGAILGMLVFIAVSSCPSQSLSRIDRERGHVMLRFLRQDLVDYYYDPGFHGVDLAARFSDADKKIDRAATLGQMFLAIGGALFDLRDAHTQFIPPPRTLRVDYGWEMAMIGDSCYVTAVSPGSDAAAKGLRAGDRICSIDGCVPSRSSMHVLRTTMEDLDPRAVVSMRFQCPDGGMNDLQIGTRRRERVRVVNSAAPSAGERTVDDAIPEGPAPAAGVPHLKLIGDSLAVWKLPRFDLSAKETGRVMETIGGSRALVLDLRNNPGGYITSLLALAGYFFDEDVTLFRAKGRTGVDSVVAHTSGRPYRGKVIVLIDSRSGSSSEIFARAMQFYGRGVVIGDVSCGSVMEAMYRQHAVGADNVVMYEANITVAAIALPDGRPLEGRGVVPDEIILPAPRDIALGLDPVMVRATECAGAPPDGWRAGELFPAARGAGNP